MKGVAASAGELVRWKARLSRWRRREQFARTVAAMRKRFGDRVLDQPGSVWREAFAASTCARALQADYVRLGADPPDFELNFAGRLEPYEFVEVLAPGRRRGDELKAERAKLSDERARTVHIPSGEWTPAGSALAQVADVTRRKVAKGYAPETNLVVYLNIWPVAGERELEDGLCRALAEAVGAFKRVWLLQNGRLRGFSPSSGASQGVIAPSGRVSDAGE